MASVILRSGGRLLAFAFVAFTVAAAWYPAISAQEPASTPAARPALSDAEIERFLKTARVVRTRSASKGVTNSLRATLTDGTITHDAQIQTIDERRNTGPSPQGTEMNFRDSWMFNIAGYKLDRLIGMNLVPVSVERRHQTTPAAFTWWIDDVQMDEAERLKKKLASPRPADWNEQIQMVRVFDQLIYNMDRNLGNLLITNDWNIWAIDHTRAFRFSKTPRHPERLVAIDRSVLRKLEALDFKTVRQAVDGHITDADVRNLLARRDAIVERFRTRGEGSLYDRPDPAVGCAASAR